MKPLRLYGVAYRGTSATRKLRLEGWSVGVVCLLAATPSPTSAPAPPPAQLMARAHEERRGSTLGATQSRIPPSVLQYEDNNEPRFGRAELEPPRPTPSTTRTPPDQHHLPFGRDPVAPVCPRTPTGPRSPLGPRCPSCLRGRCGGQMDVQGYLADKKKPPPPRTTIGHIPSVGAEGDAVFDERGTPVMGSTLRRSYEIASLGALRAQTPALSSFWPRPRGPRLPPYPHCPPQPTWPELPVLPAWCTGGLHVIRKEAWPFYRTSSGVRLCWELEEPKGPKG